MILKPIPEFESAAEKRFADFPERPKLLRFAVAAQQLLAAFLIHADKPDLRRKLYSKAILQPFLRDA